MNGRITDCFVNSQEWTLSRSVPEIRLAVLGSEDSGKSALVHRYLTGHSFPAAATDGDDVQNNGDGDEDDGSGSGGGRFKKEVSIDGQSHLLLIRDEATATDAPVVATDLHQVSSWVDAVLLVFALEKESSFNAVSPLFRAFARHRNPSEVPVILIGTQVCYYRVSLHFESNDL